MGVCNCKVLQGDTTVFSVDQSDNKQKIQNDLVYKKEGPPVDSKPSIGTQPHQGMNPKKSKK